MKLISVNPTGFFSYGIHKTIELDNKGLVLLNGRNLDRGGTSNGSGKSSLLNAICQIIYGSNPTDENGSNVINESLGKAWGRIVFEDKNGIKWRITDVKKWRKSDAYPFISRQEEKHDISEIHESGERYTGTDLFLESFDSLNNKWVDERNTNTEVGAYRLDVKATRKKIISVFGLSYEQFMNVGYMAQQQLLKFINGTHKERLAVLSDIVQLDAWDKRIAFIKNDISDLNRQKSSVEAELLGISRVGNVVQPSMDDLVLYDTQVKDLDQQLASCDLDLNKLALASVEWQKSIADLQNQLQSAIENNKTIAKHRESLNDDISETVYNKSTALNVISTKQPPHDISELENNISETRGKARARRYDLEQLMTGAGKCTRCRTNVTAEHIVRHRELLQAEIFEIETIIKDLSATLDSKKTSWADSISAEVQAVNATFDEQLAKMYSELLSVDNDLRQSNELIEQIRKQISEKGHNPSLTTDALKHKRMSILANKSRYENLMSQWHTQNDNYTKYNNIIVKSQRDLQHIDTKLKYLSEVEKLFGDKGIKAWKLNNVLNDLNHILREFIGVISNNSTTIHVTQYRTKTDGNVAADLQVLVNEGHKKSVPLSLYSGGEKQQIMLAFIGAFWTLASRHNSGLNVIFLDEILGPLDDINSYKVFDFIKILQSRGTNTIIIITHNENIKDAVMFDKVWTATKKNHITELDGI